MIAKGHVNTHLKGKVAAPVAGNKWNRAATVIKDPVGLPGFSWQVRIFSPFLPSFLPRCCVSFVILWLIVDLICFAGG